MTDHQANQLSEARRRFPAGGTVRFLPRHTMQTPRRDAMVRILGYYVPAEDLPKSAAVPMYVQYVAIDPPTGTGTCTVEQFLDDNPILLSSPIPEAPPCTPPSS